ncbi:MAG: hypothetical protein ACKOB6_07620, partial [Candidatus Kapaibacterium sp.]
FRTTNGGTNWTNISGSLPNIPMNCITFEAGSLSGMYLGTDIGVYYRNNTMNDWVSYDDGLPNVPVEDIEIFTAGEKVRVGTYGRGLWQGDVYRQGPRAIMSASRTSICAGDTLTLFDISSNATGRSWTMPGATPSSSTATNPVVSYSAPGTYAVTLIATNSFASDTLTNTTYITVNALPTATISATKTTACTGDSIVISAPALMKSYLWSTGESTSSIVLRNAGTTQVSVTITNNQNCSATSAPQSFTIFPSPITIVSGTASVCAGESGTYSVGVITPGSVYRWSRPRLGLISVGDTTSPQFTVVWNTAGRDTLFFRETNSNGCTVDRFVAVLVHPLPVVTLTGPTTACKGALQTFATASLSSGATIEWLAPRLGSIIGANNNPAGVNIRWNSAGRDTVVARATSALGCVSLAIHVCTVNDLPSVSITGPGSGCKNELRAFATGALTTGSQIQWSQPARGSIVGSSTNTAGVNILWTSAGTDSVVATVTSPEGCTSSSSFAYTINDTPTPLINGPATTCVGQEAEYRTTSASGHSFTWSLPPEAMIMSGVGTNSVRVRWTSAVKDSIRLTETSANGCSTTTTLYVESAPLATPSISGMSAVCTGGTATYSVPRTNGNTYAWSTPKKGTIQGSATTDIVSVQWTSFGTDTLTVTETNAAGCSVTARIAVNIKSQLKPEVTAAGGRFAICPGEAITLQTATGYSQYVWKKNGTDAVSTSSSLVVREAGTYSVFVTSSACSGSSDDISVTMYPPTPKPVIVKEARLLRCTTPAKTYQWYINNVILGGATGSTYTPLSSGNHCVKITDDNGCESEVECVDFIVSIPADPSESVRIEPNPVDETFRIIAPSAGSAPCAVRVLDMCGREVMRQAFSSGEELREARFQVTNEPAGVYFVVVDLGTNAPLILKLVKI